ncbi:hypothetical protein IEQ44_15200 [Nocardioides sp. Y6]|uniref:Secreted protein n=1 Tax=Nocardioides malaquae TaxID=2773426 RepID=A0ABR9RXV1_9ACTN|nr:hypothetical protein [Nocardioides malaquae]MBE7325995.1 hypothetical protein [Nocardioides malaquae]
MLKTPFAAAALSLLVLSGCASGADPAEEVAPVATPAPSQEATAGAKTKANPGRKIAKRVAKIEPGATWHSEIESIDVTEPRRAEVHTSVVDPRGADGSPEAQQARSICLAVVSVMNDQGIADPSVTVFESDGTSFVLHGHPAYPEPCTEV